MKLRASNQSLSTPRSQILLTRAFRQYCQNKSFCWIILIISSKSCSRRVESGPQFQDQGIASISLFILLTRATMKGIYLHQTCFQRAVRTAVLKTIISEEVLQIILVGNQIRYFLNWTARASMFKELKFGFVSQTIWFTRLTLKLQKRGQLTWSLFSCIMLQNQKDCNKQGRRESVCAVRSIDSSRVGSCHNYQSKSKADLALRLLKNQYIRPRWSLSQCSLFIFQSCSLSVFSKDPLNFQLKLGLALPKVL